MALTYTPAGEPGALCPPFELTDVVTNQIYSGPRATDRATLVAFLCAHCPYVRAIEDRFVALAAEFKASGLGTFAICANDPTDHPEDSPAGLKARALELKYTFPYLVDPDQRTARAFGAVCTPDFFLYGADRRLVYRGRLDDSWREAARVGQRELAAAVSALLAGRPIATDVTPSMGCSIKWRE